MDEMRINGTGGNLSRKEQIALRVIIILLNRPSNNRENLFISYTISISIIQFSKIIKTIVYSMKLLTIYSIDVIKINHSIIINETIFSWKIRHSQHPLLRAIIKQ